MGLYDKPESFKPLHWFWIIGLGLLYAVYTALTWSTGYIDFGDGNYMYISWRIAQGAVVYRDILAPQPPCHLFLGALIVTLGDQMRLLARTLNLGVQPSDQIYLYLFRAFSLLLHLATYALLLRLAWRAWGRPVTTVVAGAIWLWLPINFWWSLGYQSEPLEIFFLLAMMLAALRATFAADLLAGLFAALAALTNATAAPFLLVLILYMLFRAPLRALRMSAVCIILAGITVWTLQFWTEGAFLQNVVLNQVGTYPTESWQTFWEYFQRKLIQQSGNVLALEGFFLALALIGFWRFLATTPLDTVACGGLAWFCLATLGSIVYATKGGTEDYIFNLSEPAVALLASGELVAWGRRWTTALPEIRAGWIVRTVPFWLAKSVATVLLAAFALGSGAYFHNTIRTQERLELNAERTERIIHQIKKLSSPHEPILAPPYYAFMARRQLWGDYSELFIWQMKYWNDRRANNPEGEGWRKVRAMAQAIRQLKLPLVILEMDQTGTFPEVMRALEEHYVPLPSPFPRTDGVPPGYLALTYNTRLGIFMPLRNRTPADLARQRQTWLKFKFDLMRQYGLEGVHRKFGTWYDLEVAPVVPEPPRPTRPEAPTRIKPILKIPAVQTTQSLTTVQTTQTLTGVTTATLDGLRPRPALPPWAESATTGSLPQRTPALTTSTLNETPTPPPPKSVKKPAENREWDPFFRQGARGSTDE